MPRPIHVRLSVMMFVQYFVPGAITPIISHYLLNYLRFSPLEVGVILATPAVSAFFAPIFAARVADRWMPAERMLSVCHLAAALVMLVLARQTGFWAFLGLHLLYSILYTPTMALTNTVAFHHVPDARRDFGKVRVWGTVGWLAVGWTFGYLYLRGGGGELAAARLPQAFYVSAGASFVLALYALTLPVSHVHAPAGALPGRGALAVLTRPPMLVFCGLTFLVSLINEFYLTGASPFLSRSGFPPQAIMPAMTLGQATEIALMGFLGRILDRLGMKRVLAIGVLLQAVRYLVFAVGGPKPLLLAAVSLHGLCYTFFFATAFIYVNQHSAPHERAGVQQWYNMVLWGLGRLAGSLCAGATGEWFYREGQGIAFTGYWLVGAAVSLATFAALLAFFREEAPVAEPGVEPA